MSQGYKLMVKNIPFWYKLYHIGAMFSEFGEIDDIQLPFDHYNHSNKGYAFVIFKNKEEADKAIESKNRKYLEGKCLEVFYADKNNQNKQNGENNENNENKENDESKEMKDNSTEMKYSNSYNWPHCVFVKYLHYSLSEYDVKQMFKKYGVKQVKLNTFFDYRGNIRSKGSAFIELGSEELRQLAIKEMNKKEVKNLTLLVCIPNQNRNYNNSNYENDNYDDYEENEDDFDDENEEIENENDNENNEEENEEKQIEETVQNEVKEEKKSLANREIMFEANGIFILNPQKGFPKRDGQK